MPPEQRSERTRKRNAKCGLPNAHFTPEEWRAVMQRVNANKTPEQRRNSIVGFWAHTTPEQRERWRKEGVYGSGRARLRKAIARKRELLAALEAELRDSA